MKPSSKAAARPTPTRAAPVVKPFLKWVGGKGMVLRHILPHLPKTYGRYYEPFMGGAALFFRLAPERATLADTNERLVRTYVGLRDHTDEVIALLRSYPHEKDFFLKLRASNIDERGDAEVAAWFIYLNKTAFNGLYRVNRSNNFNVPFGRYKKPNYCNEERLNACAQRLRRVTIKNQGFAATARGARRGDLVYFDPPYVPLSTTSNFTSYTHGGFGPEQQEELRDVALKLAARGVHVLLSNSAAPLVQKLYSGKRFKRIKLQVRRHVNSRADRRGPVGELLIRAHIPAAAATAATVVDAPAQSP